MKPTKVILLACGSFNPPTNMHLRMFEIARDHLHKFGEYTVIGGIVSPVHDAYGKNELISATHRCTMLNLALQNCDWVKVSDWECKQENWSKTRNILEYHQNCLNSILNNCNNDIYDLTWVPENVKNNCQGPIQVKLLCGADLLESFGTPGLWADEDIDALVGQHGLIVITREGTNPMKFIYESDILTKYMANITIVTEWIKNEVSSTKIRRALRRSESIRYLIPDSVINYIYQHKLYGSKEVKCLAVTNYIDNIFLTPSPSDIVTMSDTSPNNNKQFSESNLYLKQDFLQKANIDIMNNINKANSIVHPGQAVKVITNYVGDHKIIKDEVGNEQILDKMKYAKSCHNFVKQCNEKVCDFKSSKSSREINEKSDKNLIKFIFTKHGIQVISDVETVV